MAETVRTKHIDAIRAEIKSLREWLDYIERDLEHDKGVIHALLLTSISESCMKIVYNAGVANGAVLNDYEQPSAPAPRSRSKKQKVEEDLRRSDVTAQYAERTDIEYGHHETLPRGEHVANRRGPLR